jgi:taurine dioxygenase
MDFDTIQINEISPALGAEVSAVDLSKSLDQITVQEIRRALLLYRVIFFRDQEISPKQHIAFARQFGEPVDYPMVEGIKNYPYIVPVLKRADEKFNFGGIWHSDTSYLVKPPMGAILVARKLPIKGGDTLFANMVLAYEALSKPMKKMLDSLVAINSSAKSEVSKSRIDRQKDMNSVPKPLIAEHPLIRKHPETDEKSLYINIGHTIAIRGMTNEESKPLLKFLFNHQRQEEFCCRFQWRPGSIAFWDNRSTQHYPLNDYHGQERLMHRITLAGDIPV